MQDKRARIIRTLIIFSIVAALLAVAFTVTAEFIKSSRAKRVIAAYASNGMLFSSNYLREGAEPAFQTVYVDKIVAEDVSNTYFDSYVTVCNFAQQNPSRTYGRTINYTLTASIVTISRDGSYNLVITPAVSSLPAVLVDDSAMLASYSGSLTYGASHTDTYKLSLPRTMLSGTKYYVYLTATPTGGAYADLQPISALIDLAIKPDANTSTWHIQSTDDRSNAISQYSGFNFRLSGSGKGTILLGWDSSKLEISKVFKQTVSATAPDPGDVPAGWAGLTAISFEVDAADVNSYDIQFYNASENVVSSWSNVAVQMLFIEDTTSP